MSRGKWRAVAALGLLAVALVVVLPRWSSGPPCPYYQSLGPVDFCGVSPEWITPSLLINEPVRDGPLWFYDLDDPKDPATGEAAGVVLAIGGPLVVKCAGTECRIQQPRVGTVATVYSPVRESAAWWELWLTGTDEVSLAMIRFASAHPAALPKEVASLIGPLDSRRLLALCGAGRGVACTVELHGEAASVPVEVHVLATSGAPEDLWSARMVRQGEALLAYAHGGCVVDAAVAGLPGVHCVDSSDSAAVDTAEASLERSEVSAVPDYHRYGSPLRRQTTSPDGTMIAHFDGMYWVECDHRRIDILYLGDNGQFCDEGAACIFWTDQNLVIQLPEVASFSRKTGCGGYADQADPLASRRPWRIDHGRVGTVATVYSPVRESTTRWELWLTGTDEVSLAMIRFASANPAALPKEVASLIGPLDSRRLLALCGAAPGVACTVELHGEGAPVPVEVHVLATSGAPEDLSSARMVRQGEALLAYAHGGCVVDATLAGYPVCIASTLRTRQRSRRPEPASSARKCRRCRIITGTGRPCAGRPPRRMER